MRCTRVEQLIVALCGVAVTATAVGFIYGDAAQDTASQATFLAQEMADHVVEEVEMGVTAAEATRGFVVASEEMLPEEFTEFVRHLRIGEQFPQLSSIGLTMRVPVAEVADFAAQITDRSGRPLQVRPAQPTGPDRWIVTHIEPEAGNAGILGIDILADPTARAAGEAALAAGAPMMTGPLDLQVGAGEVGGLTVLLPVMDPTGGAHRGFTAIVFRGADLLRAALENHHGLAVSVRDLDAPAGAQVVASTGGIAGPHQGVTIPTQLFGRRWDISVHDPAAGGVPLTTPVLIGGGGLVLTLLLCLLLGHSRDGERRAQHLAEEATAGLRASEEALACANAALEAHNTGLQRSNVELARFAHVASHDLKQPVQVVLSFAEMLQDSLQERLGPEGLDELEVLALERMVHGAMRMRNLIGDLLDLADAERGPQINGPVDVVAATGEVLGLLGPQIRELGGAVRVAAAHPVVMDGRQLIPLLQNLVGNALKFQRPGIPPQVVVSATADEGSWVLRVTDNGVGIRPEDRGRVLEAFQRVSHDEGVEGTGIGLSICAAVVDGHGGRIEIGEGTDGGTCVTVTLPQEVGRIAAPPVPVACRGDLPVVAA